MLYFVTRKKGKLLLYFVVLCVAQVLGTGFALIMSSFINSASMDVASVGKNLLVGVIYVVVCVLFEAWYSYLKNTLGKDARFALKEALFFKIMSRSIRDYENENSAEYMNELSNNINMYEELYFNGVLLMPALVIQFFTASMVCIYIEPMMLLLMLALSFVTVLSTKVTTKYLEKSSALMTQCSEEYLAEMKDDLRGHSIIRNFGVLDLIFNKHRKANEKMEHAKLALANSQLLCMYIGEFVGLMSTVLVMGVAAYFSVKGVFSAGLVIAFGHLIGQVVSPIIQLPRVIAGFRAARPLTLRFRHLLEYAPETETKICKEDFLQEIRMEDMDFSFDGERKLYGSLTMTFEKGKKYAIVGDSGRGKSTLFRLLLGNYKDYTGSLLMDGIQMRDIREDSLQPLFGLVTQETFLFNDTLYNNLTMFRQDYTTAQLTMALSQAGLTEFVANLKEGLQTKIQENGKNLSGGEKQRIGLARALLSNREILLFDEPTANLDEKNARAIEHQIFSLKNKTIIMITHDTRPELLKQFHGVCRIGDDA